MQITEMHLTPNSYSRPQLILSKVNAIVVHYVGNPGSSAIGNRNYFESLKDKRTTYASSHYIIGLDGEVIMCVPENEVAYCSNNRNHDTISIENCHPTADGKFNEKTYRSLVELCSILCKKYNLNPLSNIIRHFDVNGKKCPLYHVNNPKAWDGLKTDVQNLMKNNISKAVENTALRSATVKFNLFNDKNVEINGFIENSKTYVEVRQLLEGMGFIVGWDELNKTVLVDGDGKIG